MCVAVRLRWRVLSGQCFGVRNLVLMCWMLLTDNEALDHRDDDPRNVLPVRRHAQNFHLFINPVYNHCKFRAVQFQV